MAFKEMIFAATPKANVCFVEVSVGKGVCSWLLTGKFQSKAAQRDPPAAISRFEKGPMKRPTFCVAMCLSHGLSHARESLR